MNVKNLIGLILVTGTAARYASAPSSAQAADLHPDAATVLGTARNALAKCVQAALPRLDEHPTPSRPERKGAPRIRCG